MKLDQNYDPLEVESIWYDFWTEHGFFKADETSDKEPYTIVIPPPNVTGSLHMGHALFVTLQDILIRWKRMQGYEALWLPGTDHAGIATQVVVERQLRELDPPVTRHELGREKFLEKVWEWKATSGGRIIEQLKRMGASCDWERERFTMDDGLSHAVRTIFVQMYEDGLIYRGDRMVNWDPATQTVLSNLEVVTRKEGEVGNFWYLKYPLADDPERFIMVGTTRPETMLGDTAVAVHPDDERYQDLIGKNIRLPIVGRLIPIIADTVLPDPEKGTGAVKVTPSHDPNDYACGERHDLEQIQVIGLDAKMIAENVPEAFAGLDRYAARKLVVQTFEELGLLDRIEQVTNFPGRSERSDVIVEPLVMKQWFVKGEELAKPAIEAVESGRTRIIPELWKKTYDHFMYNILDWCISRQLWWGHQIPAWYGPDGEVFVAVDEAAALEKARAHYGQDDVTLEQDPDVLDTWFSSGLWPFSTLGWPEQTQALEKFYPTAVLETGSDILFFWVARMMMMGIYAMGEVPFSDVFLHAMVRDEKGQKMSKVKGNVIDPLHMIGGAKLDDLDPRAHRELIGKMQSEGTDELPPQGADALRLTLAILAAQANDIKLDTSRMAGYRRFLNKLWNASKFVLMNLEGFTPAPWASYAQPWTEAGPPFVGADLNLADRWILTRLDATVRAVTEALDAYRFNDAAQAVYDFVWNEFCDWYIEASKETLYDESEENAGHRAAAQATAAFVLDTSLRLLHPVAPFITEDIWQATPRGEGAPEALIVADWPIARDSARFPVAARVFDVARDLISSIRNIRGETGVGPGKTIDAAWFVVHTDEERIACESTLDTVTRLARITTIHVVSPDALPDLGPTAAAVASGVAIQIPMAGLIDVAEETARLNKELERVQADIQHVSRKLNNPKFVARAPDHIVQKERDKLAAFEKEQVTLQNSLEELQKLA